MTDDRDITERLEDKSINGAIFLRINAAMEIRRLREYSSKQALDIVTLGQEVGRLREALLGATAALTAAISLLERSPSSKKSAPSDKMFEMMLSDYHRYVEQARAALAEQEPK